MVEKITDIETIQVMVDGRRKEEVGAIKPKAEDDGVKITTSFVMACLRTNQAGDGELYKAMHRGKFIYAKNIKEWLVWVGHHWAIDEMGEAEAAVADVADKYEEVAAEYKVSSNKAESKEQRLSLAALINKLEDRARDLRGEARRRQCLAFAHTSKNPMAIRGSEIDTKPWLLACPNGVVDLKTGDFRPGRPDDLLMASAAVEWRGLYEPCQPWEEALLQIMDGDHEMVSSLRRLFGVGAVGMFCEKVFPVFTGPGGDNGKTTIVETIAYVLGELAGPIPADMLCAQYKVNSAGPSPDIMDLKGLRFAYASETEDGAKVSTARLKWLTGGDRLKGRWPNDKRPVRFEPTHMLFLLSNYKPHADSEDKAFWSRMLNYEFTLSFVKNREPVEPNERRADLGLMEKLKQCAPGILAWIIRGCLEWQKVGLMVPAKVLESSREYREGEDEFGPFVDYCTYKDSAGECSVSDLKDLYEWWYRKYMGTHPKAWKRVGMYLKPRFKSDKRGGVTIYFGLSIRQHVLEEMAASQRGYARKNQDD